MAIQSKQSPLVGGGGQFERLVGVVKRLNPRAREFRPVRRAAAVAVENIRRIVEEEAVEH